MKFTVVTSCYNAEKYIRETINSVLQQTVFLNGEASLEYIICDAGSTDGTMQIIQEFKNPFIQVFSNKDNGLYDGLGNGFSRATGDILCYLNAGDLYFNSAFSALNKIFEKYPEVQFLTSINTLMNDNGEITSAFYPYKYQKYLLKRGVYGKMLPFIQQESTFWRRELFTADILKELRTFKYAGDLFLWFHFIDKASLYVAYTQSGCFRIHKGQLSENTHLYSTETDRFLLKPNLISRFWALGDFILWKLPPALKRRINQSLTIHFDFANSRWNLK